MDQVSIFERFSVTRAFTLFPGFVLAHFVLIPAAFAVLPVSRKRAKVRWRHLVRLALYGSVFVVLPIAYAMIGLTRLVSDDLSVWRFERDMGMIAAVIVPIVLLVFWSFAVRNHLRMDHPWATAGAAVAMAYLAALACGFFVPLSHFLI